MSFLNSLITRFRSEPAPLPEQPPLLFPVRWGNLLFPNSEATNHFAVIGSTGSGKTTFLRLTLQSLLADFHERDCRAIVFDAKQDMFPILAGIIDPARITTLNPFDARGAAWDLATDLNEPRVIHEFVATLIPEVNDANPFFTNASRHLMYAVMLSYYLQQRPYTLADVFRPLRNLRQLKRVLRQHEATTDVANMYLRDRRLAHNVISSLATKIQPFEPIAAAWDHATEWISIRDWMNESRVLILGNSEVSRHSIDAINRCIFKRVTALTLNQTESQTRRIWFVLDELTDAGKLDGLIPLAKKGRSKGACLLVAFQSVSGLRAEQLYGNHGADELLGQIGNRFVGRLECVTTAEYVSQLVGEQERIEVSWSYTKAHENSSTTSYNPQVRRALLASELLDIPPCSMANGLHGLGISRIAGVYHAHLPGRELFEEDLIPPAPDVPAFVPRDAHQQILQPWTAERAQAFGVVARPSTQHGRVPADRPKPRPFPSDDPLKGLFDDR